MAGITFPIGRAFKEWRKALNWTQARACAEVGIHATDLSKIENGTEYPTLYTLDSIRKNAGIDPYVMALCWYEDVSHFPKPVQDAIKKLGDEFREYLAAREGKRRQKLW